MSARIVMIMMACFGVMHVSWKGLPMKKPKLMQHVFQEVVVWAERSFEVHRIKCPEAAIVQEEDIFGVCYGTKQSAEEWGRDIKTAIGHELTEVTGWRDDYGVLSGVFEWKDDRAYEVRFSYMRDADIWNVDPELVAVRKLGYKGLITLKIYGHR